MRGTPTPRSTFGVANETTEDDRGKATGFTGAGAIKGAAVTRVRNADDTFRVATPGVFFTVEVAGGRIEPVTVGVDVRWRGLTTRTGSTTRGGAVETIRGRGTARATGAELAVGFHCAAVPAIATEGGFTPASLNAF
ncbi:MAG: hypothetical protein ACI8W7_003809, partial [Gammaproteobacteria bacterium]